MSYGTRTYKVVVELTFEHEWDYHSWVDGPDIDGVNLDGVKIISTDFTLELVENLVQSNEDNTDIKDEIIDQLRKVVI